MQCESLLTQLDRDIIQPFIVTMLPFTVRSSHAAFRGVVLYRFEPASGCEDTAK
jgi:hypothetical protein